MATVYVLKTYGDPLNAVRQLLRDLWDVARLDGLLVPVYQVEGSGALPTLVEDLAQLALADPFLPLVRTNSAKNVSLVAGELLGAKFGAVLRSCESRALAREVKREDLNLDTWLILGVDCLASFPVEDFEWRAKKVETVEDLTRQTLRFARQGGIAPYRFRRACQMCVMPAAQAADLEIGLLGLPVRSFILVAAKDEQTSRRLCLEEITGGLVEPEVVEQRLALLYTLKVRRQRTRDRMFGDLASSLPGDVTSLVSLITSCAPCQACLEACPVYAGELMEWTFGSTSSMEAASRWLAACVGCGMCEQACPNHLPLTAIVLRISQALRGKAVTTGSSPGGNRHAFTNPN